MSYHLLNVENLDYYYCDDLVWITALDTARKNGWKPDGTLFDYVYETDDICFDIDDEMYYMWMMILSKIEFHEWDGSYHEKRNQIVMYEDTIYFAACLEGTGTDENLIEFIKKGSFRICSE